MSLKIDHREGKCKEAIQPFIDEYKWNVVFEQLEYGDFQIVPKDHTEPIFLFERKTIADLLASIKDGRYKNQKSKMLENYKSTQYFYMIEGKLKYSVSPKSKQDKIIHSAIINTIIRDKIGCLFTSNYEETVECISSIFMRYIAEPDKYKIESQPIEKQIIVETSSQDSSQTIFKKMLCQVPHINDKTAQAIVDQWGTMKEFILAFHTKTKEEQQKELNQIKVNGRKISKRVVEEICNHCF